VPRTRHGVFAAGAPPGSPGDRSDHALFPHLRAPDPPVDFPRGGVSACRAAVSQVPPTAPTSAAGSSSGWRPGARAGGDPGRYLRPDRCTSVKVIRAPGPWEPGVVPARGSSRARWWRGWWVHRGGSRGCSPRWLGGGKSAAQWRCSPRGTATGRSRTGRQVALQRHHAERDAHQGPGRRQQVDHRAAGGETVHARPSTCCSSNSSNARIRSLVTAATCTPPSVSRACAFAASAADPQVGGAC